MAPFLVETVQSRFEMDRLQQFTLDSVLSRGWHFRTKIALLSQFTERVPTDGTHSDGHLCDLLSHSLFWSCSTHEPIQCTHDVNYTSFEIVQFNHLTGELRHTWHLQSIIFRSVEATILRSSLHWLKNQLQQIIATVRLRKIEKTYIEHFNWRFQSIAP